MKNQRNDNDGRYDRHDDDQDGVSRNNKVLRGLKLALATGSGLGTGERGHGFDPYNSRLGAAPRDVWGRNRR